MMFTQAHTASLHYKQPNLCPCPFFMSFLDFHNHEYILPSIYERTAVDFRGIIKYKEVLHIFHLRTLNVNYETSTLMVTYKPVCLHPQYKQLEQNISSF